MRAEPEASRATGGSRRLLPWALMVLGLVGTGVLWEPLTGIFGDRVQLNGVGTGAFALWALVVVAGLAISLRRPNQRSRFDPALLGTAALLTCLVVTTWVFIFANGSIGVRAQTSNSVPLEK